MSPVKSVAAIPNYLILLLSVEQYPAMIEAGILADDSKRLFFSGQWTVDSDLYLEGRGLE